jgi:hypothetical protein
LGLDEKIKVIELDLPSRGEQSDPWFRERAQRDAAASEIKDEDICIVSDCDEIINPNFLDYYISVSQKKPNNILRIPMYFLCSRADLRVYDENSNPISWCAPFMCTKEHIASHSLSEIRESYVFNKNNLKYSDILTTENGIVQEAGWHFSWMGPIERMKIKGRSFSHCNEFNVLEDYEPKDGSSDPLGRQGNVLKNFSQSLLPQLVFQITKVKEFLLPNTPQMKESE